MDSNKNNPVISIITPYFNGQDYIEETAKSVLRQTFSNFEWIIVDDGSSKEGKEKLQQIEKMDSRIKFTWPCRSKRSWNKKFIKNY